MRDIFEEGETRRGEIFVWESFMEVVRNHSAVRCGETNLGSVRTQKPLRTIRDGVCVKLGVVAERGDAASPRNLVKKEKFSFYLSCSSHPPWLWGAAQGSGLCSGCPAGLSEVPVPQEVGLDLICCK